MTCDAIGTYTGVREKFAEFAVGHDSDGSCQSIRVGPDSPGPIHDSESLARYVFGPIHLAKADGAFAKIDESLFSDAMTIGCSVSRLLAYAGQVTQPVHTRGEAIAQEIRRGSSERQPRPDRCYLGTVKLVAGDVRALRVDEVEKRIRVYDTSRGACDPLHGDIIANAAGASTQAEKIIRKNLRVALYMLAQRSGLIAAPQYADRYDLANFGFRRLPVSDERPSVFHRPS